MSAFSFLCVRSTKPKKAKTRKKEGLNEAECGICFQLKKVVQDTQIYKNQTTKCSLNHPYCQTCLSKHITYKLHQTKSPIIRCPGCPQQLDPLGCSTILSPDVFVKWTDHLAESMLNNNQIASKRVVCPYRGCFEIFMVDDCGRGRGRGTQVSCPWCLRLFCLFCKAKGTLSHHHYLTCVDVDDEDALFMRAARSRGFRRCPHCGFVIQRTFGCDTIVCRCGGRFCYRCGSIKCAHVHCDDYGDVLLTVTIMTLMTIIVSYIAWYYLR